MNRAHIGAVGLVVMVATACGTPDDPPVGADAGSDAAPDEDTIGPAAGIVVEFESRPSIPGTFENQDRIDAVEIALVNLRVQGDVTPDDRTTEPSFTLDWVSPMCGSAECAEFPQAPPGLYSLVVATITSFRIEGEVDVGGNAMPFVIEDPAADLDVDFSFPPVPVHPGDPGRIQVEVRLDQLVEEVDWEQVPVSGEGVLELGPSDPQFDDVEDRLEQAFESDD